jgi:hypothetical protein
MMMVSISPTLPLFTAQPYSNAPQLPVASNPPSLYGAPLGSPMGMPYMNEIDSMLQQVNAFTASLQGWANNLFLENQQREAAEMQMLMNGLNPTLASTQPSSVAFDSDAEVQKLLKGLYQQQSGKIEESVKAIKQATTSPASASSSASPTSSSSSAGKADSQKKIILGNNNADGSVKLASIGNGHQLQADAAAPFMAASKSFKATYGYDLPVISSYRSPEHNHNIGGSPTSNHIKGVSLDLDANTLSKKGHYMAAVKALRAEGFEPLDGVSYVKHGKAQDEYNHFDYVGKGNTSNDWHGPNVS